MEAIQVMLDEELMARLDARSTGAKTGGRGDSRGGLSSSISLTPYSFRRTMTDVTTPAVTVYATDEFAGWYDALEERHRERVAACVDLLEQMGIALGFPYSSAIVGSAFALRELRIQSHGHAMRVFYAFDPQRDAVVLIDGDNGLSDERFYREHVPKAERILREYLAEIEEEDDG
jgi:hypothetical protein